MTQGHPSLPMAGTHSGYVRVHRLARMQTRQADCRRCGATGPSQAALRPDAPHERLLLDPIKNCVYSNSPADYEPLCAGCHYRQDFGLRTHCRRGHAYTPENTAPGKEGTRRCRACNRASKLKTLSTSRGREARLAQQRSWRAAARVARTAGVA